VLNLTVFPSSGVPVRHQLDVDRITLGRGEACLVVIDDLLVSRPHTELRRCDHGWTATDLGSRHGTQLNGVPLDGTEPLRSGDELKLGSVVIVFEPCDGPRRAAQGAVDTRSREPGADDDEAAPVLVGQTAAMRSVRTLVGRLASATATVLITGESGTGKEVVARLLHQRSARAASAFVVVNCPALPGSLIEYELFGVAPRVATEVDARPGQLEMADTGTLFLDEIGDMDLGAQAKLLRFLQDKKVERIGGRGGHRIDVRVVAATNHDLQADIAAGRFRLDLYHRLNTIHIALPPLRERRADIEVLVEHFLTRAGAGTMQVADEVLERLARYRFPGNVRELERILERARLLADGPLLTADLLPDLELDDAPASGGDPCDLCRRLSGGGESFWDLIHRPFLARQLSADVVRAVVQRGHDDAGGSYREMGRAFGIEDHREYKKLISFLRNHDLTPDRRPRRD